MKLVEWNFQNSICNNMYVNSTCIIIDDEQLGSTRSDHIHSFSDGQLGNWNTTPSNNNRWN